MITRRYANRETSARNGGGNPVPSLLYRKVNRLSKINNKCNSYMENKVLYTRN
nr:MAG TPA: hypothetical protein [Caudoviricetes sp.]